ncbi:MAG: hypothetical protein JSV03_08610, partial [Planctomycetota bacterium]
MKKLIMIATVLTIAGRALALKYPDIAPDFICCDNSGWVIWEFLDDWCLPTSEDFDPPYGYYPEAAVDPPTFGSRHWDDPFDDSGWGGSYGEGAWTYTTSDYNGAYTINAEDSFAQPIPLRGDKQYLRQYFQVVHTMPPGVTEEDYYWPIGIGLEIWDMSVFQENGWTGCPVGYEGLAGDGYRGG